MIPVLDTSRLRLRDWREDDRAELARLNADPRVMQFFARPLERAESDAMFDRIRERFVLRGYGLWAVEEKGGAPLIGFVGLAAPVFRAHFTPCVEVGWRLAPEYWGRGYATEAGRAALAFGFDERGMKQIVSFTTEANVRSRRVMERLGLRRDPRDDFDHPLLERDHPLRRHVLYRLNASEWRRSPSVDPADRRASCSPR